MSQRLKIALTLVFALTMGVGVWGLAAAHSPAAVHWKDVVAQSAPFLLLLSVWVILMIWKPPKGRSIFRAGK